MTTEAGFLFRIYGQDEFESDNQFITFWQKTGKLSKHFNKIELAQKHLETVKNKTNLYYGVGLRHKNLGASKKGFAKDISGIPGLWMDIDIASPDESQSTAHTKKNLPPSIDHGIALVKGYGFDPTYIIHSGHGLHAYWLFKEIWMFDDDRERDQAARLNQALHTTILGRAGALGWSVDNCSNLDRVLRPAGTVNVKEGCSAVDVIEIEYHENLRYNPEDLAEYLVSAQTPIQTSSQTPIQILTQTTGTSTNSPTEYPTEQQVAATFFGDKKAKPSKPDKGAKGRGDSKTPTPASTPITDGNLALKLIPGEANRPPVPQKEIDLFVATIDFDAEAGRVSPEQFQDLEDNFNPKFRATWQQRRLDFPKGDMSMSTYIFAIAVYAKKLDFSHQDTIHLISQFYRQHGQIIQVSNKQKYARTVLRAQEIVEEENEKEELDRKEIQAIKTAPPDVKKKWMDHISEQLQVGIIKIERIMQHDISFRIETSDGVVSIPDASHLVEQRKFRLRLTEVTKTIIPMLKAKEWEKTVQIMLNLSEDRMIAEEDTQEGRIRLFIQSYIEASEEKTFEDAVFDKKPFKHEGNWFIFSSDLCEFLFITSQGKFTVPYLNKEMATVLGMGQQEFKAEIKGRRITKRPWLVPDHVLNS